MRFGKSQNLDKLRGFTLIEMLIVIGIIIILISIVIPVFNNVLAHSRRIVCMNNL
ncbi:prepilin-type N-terminal cleavage/methylation domain-containing protein, partial [Planctomycetota bacterium]